MKLGLALSGGGIRGIAHAGVLKAFEDNNIKIDVIGGTSSGSLVVSLYAMGYSPYYIYILFKKYAKDIVEINSNPIITGIGSFVKNKKIAVTGLKTGEKIEEAYNHLAERKGIKNITNIKMPLVIPTVDLNTSKEYIFTNNKLNLKEDKYISDISLGKAVRASSSFPAIFSPCKYKTYNFLDGGILNNIPVEEVKKNGADKVIAVNFKADDITEDSNIMDIIMRTLDIMGNKISTKGLKSSEYILTIKKDKTGLLDIEKLDECYMSGYKMAKENIEKIKNSIYS